MTAPSSVTTTTIGSRHYALVASFFDDGVQIIDITDPSSPTAVASVTDRTLRKTARTTRSLTALASVTTTTIPVDGADKHYALVASRLDNGVQIIDITNPSSPSAVAGITDCTGSCTAPTDYTELDGAYSVTTATIPVNGSRQALRPGRILSLTTASR